VNSIIVCKRKEKEGCYNVASREKQGENFEKEISPFRKYSII